MNQPRGRYSGSRDKGPRQSRQPSTTTPHRQNKPYVKAQPARDPAQTASIFKTRSFKWLVDAVGAENIALGLDSNLTRVEELIKGEKFTPETAFHIETTLGLPDGFFDQPNPALTSETIRRLRAPLDFVRASVEPEYADVQELDVAPAAHAHNHPSLIDRLPREPDMPKKTAGGSPQTAAKSKPADVKTATPPTPRSASAKAKAPIKPGAQQSLPLNDGAAVQNIRRANLHVLTARKGSKVRLSAVIGISASNLDNRLYGQKRMDDAEANRFTERLGLPVAWLDIPRSVTDIPESVSALLDPQSGRPASGEQEVPAANKVEPTAAAKSTSRKTKAASDQHAQPSGTDHPGGGAVLSAVEEHQDPVLPPVSNPVALQPVDKVPSSAPVHQPAPDSFTQVIEEPRRGAPVTSLDDLMGIAPIAEALIKTLAGKARTGRLDETQALALLQQIVSL